MLEVCSTTFPQYVIPEIYESEKFKEYIKKRIKKYKEKVDYAENIFSKNDMVTFIKPRGAFYMTIKFNLEKFEKNYIPEMKNKKLAKFMDER